MTPIEIMALILAAGILIKFIVSLVSPSARLSVAKTFYKSPAIISVVFLVLAAISGYYIFAEFNIVQVAAIMLFTAFLIGLAFAPYSQSMIKVFEEMLASREAIFKRNWLSIIIWTAIALWVIYALFFV